MRNAAELSIDLRAARPRPAAPTRARAGRRRRRSRGRGRRSSRRAAPRTTTSPPPNGKLAALGTRRRVAAQLVDRERALLEDAQHLGADHAGGTHRARLRTTLISRPRRARTPRAAPAPPRSTSSSATTHEIRIVDVLIISMLMPSVASISNILAAMPGCVFMPAPTSETRPMSLVGAVTRSPRCRRRSSPCTTPHASRSARGTVNEMSVWPAVETFCTIMSTLTPASASVAEHRGRDAGPVGHLLDRDLGLRGVVRDAGDDRLLHRFIDGSSSSVTQVPGAQVKLDRTCTLHVVVARELDRPQREHPAAGRGHLEHLVERDARRACARRARSAGRRCTRPRRRCRSRTRRRRARPRARPRWCRSRRGRAW